MKAIPQLVRHSLLYGGALALLVFLLKWMQWKFMIIDHSTEIYVGLIAVFFTLLGIWVATQLTRTKVQTVFVEKQIIVAHNEERNEEELIKLGLSQRETEVLELLVKGQSNAEIAATLFLSVSTIKTHVSNVFVKLDVKNRTQAAEKAKRLKIIA
ncbi:MAG: response regulator transcription factor [Bacteroidota bacterium]|jgi:NarL family two-component system response regulator LiaR